MIVGYKGENPQYFVCAEKKILCQTVKIKEAFLDIIAVYYVYNISYPKFSSVVLLFFQQYVFNIKDSQIIPIPLIRLISSLNAL